jgi:hypothetical protein
VSSNPPDYGKTLAKSYGDGGSFDITLMVKPQINATTDCSTTACAIVARPDDSAVPGSTIAVVLPVSFGGAEQTSPNAAPSQLEAGADDEGGSSSVALPVVVAAVIAVAGGGTAFAVLRRKSGAA